jgi:hypothetical protein
MSRPQPASSGRQLPRGHLLVLNRSFRRTLEAENKSPRTIEAYTDAVRLLATFCQAHGQPLLAGELRREHIQEFIADQLARWKPATAHNRYRGLHAFFKWAVAEGDLTASPMGGMKPPQLSEQPVEVIRLEHHLVGNPQARPQALQHTEQVVPSPFVVPIEVQQGVGVDHHDAGTKRKIGLVIRGHLVPLEPVEDGPKAAPARSRLRPAVWILVHRESVPSHRHPVQCAAIRPDQSTSL